MRSSVLRMAARIKARGVAGRKERIRQRCFLQLAPHGSAYPFKNSFRNSSKSRAGGMAPSVLLWFLLTTGCSLKWTSLTLRKTVRPAKLNRVLSKARLCIANEPYFFGLDVINAADEIDDFSAGRVVVKRADGEIPPKRVFLQRAESTVAQNHAAVIMDDFVGYGLAEGRYFDQITAKSHMYDRSVCPRCASGEKVC